MTGVLVALLAVLWAAVLLPALLRARENSSVSVSVGAFNRGMRALGSNHQQPVLGGRWVLAPRSPLDEPDPRDLIFRRRRIFCSLLAALLLSLPVSLVPGLRFMLWASALAAVTLGGYTVFLIQEKNRRRQRFLSRPPAPGPVRRPASFDVPGPLQAPAPVRYVDDGVRTRPVYVISDSALEEDDDGLSELGWARVGGS